MKSKYYIFSGFLVIGAFFCIKTQTPPIEHRVISDDNQQKQQENLKLFFDNLSSPNIYSLLRKEIIGSLFSKEEFIDALNNYQAFIQYLADHINFIIKNQSNDLIDLFRVLHTIEISFDLSEYRDQNKLNNFFEKIVTPKKIIGSAIAKNIMLFNKSLKINDLFATRTLWFLKDIPFDKTISTALDHIKELSPQLAEVILSKTQNSQLAKAILIEKHFPEKVILLAEIILASTKDISPTLLHLKQHRDIVVARDFFIPFIKNPALKNIYTEFRNKENELNKQGYYTFVHGQRRQFYLQQRLYTHLWELRKKQPVKNFLFIHLNDLVDTEETKFEEDILRKTIHMAGTVQDNMPSGMDPHRRMKVLFMNYAFFANSVHFGSNSAYYVVSNAGFNPLIISSKIPFKLLGYESIYQKYAPEIEQLANDYQELSPFGNMLLIAIPKDKIYKYVFVCDAYAKHSPVLKKDGTQITDVRVTMETLLKRPEELRDSDQIEFCLIMTQQKGGLDPSTGIQIFPLLSGDPEKLKVLQEREKILLDKITADVKEAEKQQALQRATKITGHVVESAEAK